MVLHYFDDLLKIPMGGNLEIGLSRKTLLMSHAVCANPTSASRKGRRLLPSTVRRQSITSQAGTGNIFQAFAQQDAKQREQKSCEENARDAELIYLHHMAHGIPPHVASCTTLLFKQMFPDSKIAEKFTLGGCPDHHIANALKYALLAFDSKIKNIFVDVYYYYWYYML